MTTISNGNQMANQEACKEFILPALPFNKTDLEPHLSSNTFDFHHEKHHQAYVTNLNNLIIDTDLRNKSLEEIIMVSANDPAKIGIFNNAAQVWNHTFYWHSMAPNGGGKPSGNIASQIDKDFGSYDKFIEEFTKAGTTQFGSGWAWLVWDGSKLAITKTPNAELPLTKNQHALLTCDVWEHAYYLDYQNKRPVYLSTFLEKLVNWQFAEDNFNKATS
jgi:Fe-Mn family superoxide dismutase